MKPIKDKERSLGARNMFAMRWPSLGMDEWAAYERRVNGTFLLKVGSIWWCPVRFLFFRPLNVLANYPENTRGPLRGMALGAVQFPVAPSASTRSFIRLIVSDPAPAYSAKNLPSPVLRHIRKASRGLSIQQIRDPQIVAKQGYDVYREFHARTAYQHLRERLHRECFEEWVAKLFAVENLRVLGAFHGDALCAMAITFRVDDVVHYNSYFGNSLSLTHHASDYMLHSVRAAAAEDPAVQRVFAARAGMPRGLDEFYLRRGFKYVLQPAIVRGNPMVLASLKWVAPRAYMKLFGDSEESKLAEGERWGGQASSNAECD